MRDSETRRPAGKPSGTELLTRSRAGQIRSAVSRMITVGYFHY